MTGRLACSGNVGASSEKHEYSNNKYMVVHSSPDESVADFSVAVSEAFFRTADVVRYARVGAALHD